MTPLGVGEAHGLPGGEGRDVDVRLGDVAHQLEQLDLPLRLLLPQRPAAVQHSALTAGPGRSIGTLEI